MLDNKSGQIGETMTWVIATLVIVVILSISVFATSILASGSTKKLIYLVDKEKDFIATKSITSFLRNSDNVGLLENENYGDFKIKNKKLTEVMQKSSLQSAWDFELSEKEEVKIEIIHTYTAPGDSPVVNAFEINILLKQTQTELKYWKKCKDICK